ncbi:hypothetical protein IJM86_08495 [bacterium]|nr:hypothetical protein [bacterium]
MVSRCFGAHNESPFQSFLSFKYFANLFKFSPLLIVSANFHKKESSNLFQATIQATHQVTAPAATPFIFPKYHPKIDHATAPVPPKMLVRKLESLCSKISFFAPSLKVN